MANFPHFDDINALGILLSQQEYQNLSQVGDDGKTYFAQIVDHIHDTLSVGEIMLEANLLAEFINLIIDHNYFNFSANFQIDAQGFTPLGHLFKNFSDNKSAKVVFRALIAKEVEIDWYQNSKLNAYDNLVGPVLVKILTQTHLTNVIKRINECQEKGIVIDFDLLAAQDPGAVMMPNAQVAQGNIGLLFSQHLVNVLNGNGISVSLLHKMLPALSTAQNIEHYLRDLILKDTYNAKLVLDAVNSVGLKIDVQKLPLVQMFTLNMYSTADIEKIFQIVDILQTIHNQDAGLDVNHLFNIPEGENPIQGMMNNMVGMVLAPNGPSLVTHIISSVMPHNSQQFILEIFTLLARHNIKVDLNVRDSQGFSGWQHLSSKLFSNGPVQLPLKRILKDFMQIPSIPKEELVSLFINFMPIEEVIEIAHKHEYEISFNKPFNANSVVVNGLNNMMPHTIWFPNTWMGMPARETSLIDMLFSHWSQGNQIRNLDIIKKMQFIDHSIDLGHTCKIPMVIGGRVQEFGFLDCIATDGADDSFLKMVIELDEMDINLPMIFSYAKKFAVASKFPSIFKQITALKMFKEADPKLIATFLLNIKADDFITCLATLLDKGMKIDFSNDMQQLIDFIEGNVVQQGQMMNFANAMPVLPMMHHQHSLVALDKMLQVLANDKVVLAKGVTLISPQIIHNYHVFDEVIELLNILSVHEVHFPCDLHGIAIQVWNSNQAFGDVSKEIILDTLKLFETTKLYWEKFFGEAMHQHGTIDGDFKLFKQKVDGIDVVLTYKYLLKHTSDLEQILYFLERQHPNISEIRDEVGDTVWHFAAENTNWHLNYGINPFAVHKINFNLSNNAGETVFARMVKHQNASALIKMLRDVWHLIEEQNVDVNQPTTDGELALLRLAMDVAQVNVLPEFITRCKPSVEFWFNINATDKFGVRVIDVVADYFRNGKVGIDLIRALRETGSVEPKTPICKGIEFKVDVSEGRLEEYRNNKQNAIKLVELLYKQYPLSEGDINTAIDKFKARDFGRQGEVEWTQNDPMVNTIPMVIDAITGVYNSGYSMGTAAQIGFNDTERGNHWTNHSVDCKKVIGTMIHMVGQNPGLMVKHPLTGEIRLEDLFIYCLTSLKACVPGKLVNLMSVAQEALSVDVVEIDYADEKFTPQCVELTSNLFNATLDKFKHLPQKAIINWVYDMTTNIDHPENWTGSTQIMHGILNQLIRGILPDHLSYHFKKILDCRMLQFAHQINPAEYHPDYLMQDVNRAWIQAARDGVIELARELCKKVVENPESMATLFKAANTSMSLAFGDFSVVERDVFIHAANALPKEKVAEFLVLLIDKFTLADDVLQILSEILICQSRVFPDQLAEALKANYTVLGTIDASEQSIKELVLFIANNKRLDKAFDYMVKDVYSKITAEEIEQMLTGCLDEILQEGREEIKEEANAIGEFNELDE